MPNSYLVAPANRAGQIHLAYVFDESTKHHFGKIRVLVKSIHPPLPIKLETISITLVVRARSYAGLAISRTPKNHVECDVECKIYKRTYILCTIVGCKVHVLFWSSKA